MSEIKVRSATAAEAGRIAGFNRALALETEGLALEEKTVAAGVVALMGHPERGFYLVAEVAGAVAGCLLITYEWSDWRNGTFWWIQSVYVLPEARRKGVFGALFRHVEQLAERDPDVCGIRLYVERENTRAQATYRHYGLHDAGYTVMEVDYTAAAHRTDTGEDKHAG